MKVKRRHLLAFRNNHIEHSRKTEQNAQFTLPKFQRYNKASLGELILLEILSNPGGHCHWLVYAYISCEVCKGLTKC